MFLNLPVRPRKHLEISFQNLAFFFRGGEFPLLPPKWRPVLPSISSPAMNETENYALQCVSLRIANINGGGDGCVVVDGGGDGCGVDGGGDGCRVDGGVDGGGVGCASCGPPHQCIVSRLAGLPCVL